MDIIMEIELTSENFENEVLNAKTPVLVDFWASWCGPCKMVAPIIGELAGEYDGKAKVGKVNVDEQAELAMKYNIVSIPTVIQFNNGEIAEKLVGAYSKDDYEDILDKYI